MKKKKVTFSIKARLLLIALVPSIILSVTLSFLAAKSIQEGMQEEALNGLRGIAFSLQEVYEFADSGEYAMDASGVVMKGALQISDNYTVVDIIKASTDYDVTIFYGDTRVTTSLKDVNTGERLVGTKASDKVIQTVLNEGKEYSDTQVVINGEPYYGYYVPLTQNGTVVGMAFAGTPSESVNDFITEKTSAVVGFSILTLVVITIIALNFVLRLSRSIKKAQEVISEMSQGNLQLSVDARSKKRTDEVGAMTRELEDLLTKLVEIIGNVKQSSKVLFTSGSSLEEMATQSSNTTDEISKAVEGVSRGATSQAEETETASHNIEEMGNVITGIVESVETLG